MRSGWMRALLAVLGRPSLWVTAAVETVRLIPSRWWSRRPFLPLPDRSLMNFRIETQYGDADHSVDSHDLITWLQWCRAENQRTRRRHGVL